MHARETYTSVLMFSKSTRLSGGATNSLRVEISVFAHYDFYAALIAAQQQSGDSQGIDKAVRGVSFLSYVFIFRFFFTICFI